MEEMVLMLSELGQRVMMNPIVILGAIVFVVLAVKDFRGVVMPLIRTAIENAEIFLQGQAGEEKLRAAVDFVCDMLPLPYRLLVPRAMVVQLVQAVFNREFRMMFDRSKVQAAMTVPPKVDEGPSS